MKIMKGIKILLFALICLVAQGCTRNDGNIGPLWGTWRVVSMEIDNEKDETYKGTLYFCFQASVYCQRYVYDEKGHVLQEGYAFWEYVNDDILVIFPGIREGAHRPLDISGMQIGENFLKVEYFKGDDLVLLYVNDNQESSKYGTQYRYRLKRW